jgi:cobalamin biosynthesis protein CobT
MVKVTKKAAASVQENKSQLAKLMASENIQVRHMPVRTASFNLKDRVLTCPIWTDMTGNIYDLLMGHEISHALHTPMAGWHNAIVNDKKRKNIKRFLNVVEDARIERIIKNKYQGLRKPFADAYQELFDRDLFKVKKLKGDYSKLGLIDRINVHFKLGAQALVNFNTTEQGFVDRISIADTWVQVEQLAREIYDYQKANAKPKEPQAPQPKQKPQPKKDQDQGGDDSEEDDDTSSDGNDADPDDSEEDAGGESDDMSATDEDGDSDTKPKEGGKSDKAKDKLEESEEPVEPDSETDKAFRAAEDSLHDPTAEAQAFFKLPEADLKEIIVTNKQVLETFERGVRGHMTKHYPGKMNYDTIAMAVNKVFHTRNKNYIQLLVKEFEMRKNANQYSRQLTAKSGELDGNRLARYRVTNDLFRKVTTVQKGKNHGMIMFLDMSESMRPFIRYVVEQALILSTFCKRVGIPFDLYGYTDGHKYTGFGSNQQFSEAKDPDNTFNLSSGSFCLRHMLSSKFSGNHYKRAFNMVNMFGELSNAYGRSIDVSGCFPISTYSLSDNGHLMGMDLGGTPFIETLVASKEIIKHFKNEHHSDIVNVIYLSDGDGNQSMVFPYEFTRTITPYTVGKTKFGVTDPATKISVLPESTGVTSGNYRFNMFQAALTELIQETTGARHIGYYFGDYSNILDRVSHRPGVEKSKLPGLIDQLKKSGYVAVPNLGYSNYYYVDVAVINDTNKTVMNSTMTPDQLGVAFTANQRRKQNNKLIARQFAAEVAE